MLRASVAEKPCSGPRTIPFAATDCFTQSTMPVKRGVLPGV
jgi:hypothetical protein